MKNIGESCLNRGTVRKILIVDLEINKYFCEYGSGQMKSTFTEKKNERMSRSLIKTTHICFVDHVVHFEFINKGK